MSFRDWLSKMNPFKKAPPEGSFAEIVRPSLTSNLPASQPNTVAETFATDDVDAFLHFGKWLPVQSSNVAEIRYDPDESELQIRFLNGGYYQYQDVSVREAESLARSSSKGKWVWDFLRVRGTIFGHRKPYQFISAPSSYQPQWMRRAGTRALHGQIGPEGERSLTTMKSLMPKGWQRIAKKFRQ